jgi:hypothetical protein
MAFPSREYFTVLEASVRWECTQTEVACQALKDALELVATFPSIELVDGPAVGLLAVQAAEIMPLYQALSPTKKTRLRQVRKLGRTDWQRIEDPVSGVWMTAGDILITRTEVLRFEDDHDIVRSRLSGAGAPPRYDWERFQMVLFKRLFHGGMPASQKDLIDEMQEWFIANSTEGDAPDESTIRRRIKAVWQELHAA